MRAFSDTMRAFNEARWKPGFDKVLRRAEMAKLAAEAAQKLLERHIAEHTCGSAAAAATAYAGQLY